MEWPPQQRQALADASDWIARPNRQVFRLFGFAGTGKSTLAKYVGKKATKVVYGAFTGKAAMVMRRKGCAGASTLHSMIYKMEEGADRTGGKPKFHLNPLSEVKDAGLVIVDEVSMVDAQLGMDLLSFGVPVLVLGDPFQLPPVKGSGYFTANQPDVMLTEIHRQAAGNPIIQMATAIREGKPLDYGTYGTSRVISRSEVTSAEVMAADQVLVGRNKTRQTYNARIRELMGRKGAMPEEGDRVVCLKNDAGKRIFNGMTFSVIEAKFKPRGRIDMVLKPEDAGSRVATVAVVTHELFFLDRQEEMTWGQRMDFNEFTYGYALTCHKSQGSQWDNVYLFDESAAFRRDGADRWLYTAVTRAAEQITVVR